MSSACTTKRYYTLGNTVIAVRDSATGALNYLLGDQLGSTTTSVNASTGATQTQRFLPYGAPRSGGIAATDRGWIGQTKDGSTGRQYLNARYYDPTIGRFTATDPLADLSAPGSIDAYGYGRGSPVTLKDPTGLIVDDCVRGNASCSSSGGRWTVNPKPPAQARPAVAAPVTPSAEAVQEQIDIWLKQQAPAAFIGNPTREFAQYMDWMDQCKVFDEHYCVGAQALALGGSLSLAEELMGQCTIGNLCRSDGVVRDPLAEFFIIDLPVGILTGTVVKGLPGLLAARGGQTAAARVGIEFAEDNAAHIFRSAVGHLADDTAANRALIQSAVAPENFVHMTRNGVSTYRVLLGDGTQAWAEVYGGRVTNGGVNAVPR